MKIAVKLVEENTTCETGGMEYEVVPPLLQKSLWLTPRTAGTEQPSGSGSV